MAYGFQIYDINNELEYDSTQTINGGVFYKQITIPQSGDVGVWKDIIFDNASINLEISSSPEKEFKDRDIYYIILIQGTQEIKANLYSNASGSWPRIQYKRPSGTINRYASIILVFIK